LQAFELSQPSLYFVPRDGKAFLVAFRGRRGVGFLLILRCAFIGRDDLLLAVQSQQLLRLRFHLAELADALLVLLLGLGVFLADLDLRRLKDALGQPDGLVQLLLDPLFAGLVIGGDPRPVGLVGSRMARVSNSNCDIASATRSSCF
jgi:hypothetical protein